MQEPKFRVLATIEKHVSKPLLNARPSPASPVRRCGAPSSPQPQLPTPCSPSMCHEPRAAHSVVGPRIAQQLEAQLGYCLTRCPAQRPRRRPLHAIDATQAAQRARRGDDDGRRAGGRGRPPAPAPQKKVEPFPTTYWLAHGGIAAAVANVERDGGVRRAGAAVDSDAMARAHAAYAADRWALLDDEERAFVQDRGWDSLRTVGVAGIRDGGTKCLHAHYAHFLATRANPVGEWVHERLPEAIPRLCPPTARARGE